MNAPERPPFAEPWQAEAFALAVSLSAAGHFTWREWSEALGAELAAAAARGEPDDGTHYYEHWPRPTAPRRMGSRSRCATATSR